MARQYPSLVLTRPETASMRFAEAARARLGADLPVLIAPLTAIALRPQAVGPGDLIFTSENGVAGFAGAAAGRRAWCVGPRTARVARARGFDVIEGPGDAEGLARLIVAAGGATPLHHLRGREVAMDLAAVLGAHGLHVTDPVVYEQADLPPPPALIDALIAALQGEAPLLVPLFSPNSARRFAQCLTQAEAQVNARDVAVGPQASLYLAPISAKVADICASLPHLHAETAERPDAAGVVDALARLHARYVMDCNPG